MRKGLFISALASSLLLSGCTPPWQKKPQTTPPPQAQAPTTQQQPQPETPPPAKAALKLPKPQTPPPATPPAETKPAEPVHHKRLKPSPATPETAQTPAAAPAQSATTPAANQQTASAGPPAASSAIGQLSEGGSASSGDLRNQTVDLIASVERKLKDISRPLSAPEEKTAAQVRKFLQQATDALHSQDVDAAHTLATKASVLLEELLK